MSVKKREPIPATVCDHMIRMNLKCIESFSNYMSHGCKSQDTILPCVSLIELREHIDSIIERYSR